MRRCVSTRRWLPAVTAVSLAGLAACTDPQDIVTARLIPIAGAAFDEALYGAYLDLADAEIAQADWIDADRYFEKAQAVSRGEDVAPEQLEDWVIPDDLIAPLTTARAALVDVLARGAPEFAPDDAAAAQTTFDCWVEQQEEAFQTDDIAACRSAFEAALARAQAATTGVIAVLLPSDGEPQTAISFASDAGEAVIDQPNAATQASGEAPTAPVALRPATVDNLFGEAIAAQPDDPVDTILYFEPGTATLTAESAALIDGLVASALGRPVTSLRVVGHTDTVGPAAINARLSVRRAAEVRDLLVAAGLPTEAIDVLSLGESDPLVPTPDETDEPLNRRVVVTVR